MVRVKHAVRRRGMHGDQGTILVGASKYQLNENGEVEVTEAHAAAMLQGSKWTKVGPVPAPEPKTVVEDDSREDLVRQAEALGIKVDRRLSKLKIQQAIEAAKKRGDK